MTPPRKVLLLATTLAITTAIVAAPASAPARAAKSCDGDLILSKPMKDGKRKVGEFDIYWNAKTKKNCAIVYHAGSTWGKRLHTFVSLSSCKKGAKPGDPCYDFADNRVNTGRFRYQAGPVRVKAAHRCIVANGAIYLRNGNAPSASTGGAAFCK
jgi:hypothetical protein